MCEFTPFLAFARNGVYRKKEITMGIFAGSEIVEIGIQIEKNGKDFYDTLAGSPGNEKAKEIFAFLSKEEAKHIIAFQKILASVEQYEPAEAYPGEYFAYMRALASEHVFTQKDKGKELAKKVKSVKEAVDMGIGFEKDSIIFYEGMKKVVPSFDVKILDELIAQEQSHLRKLTELKSTL
jgi:rubrerythrin